MLCWTLRNKTKAVLEGGVKTWLGVWSRTCWRTQTSQRGSGLTPQLYTNWRSSCLEGFCSEDRRWRGGVAHTLSSDTPTEAHAWRRNSNSNLIIWPSQSEFCHSNRSSQTPIVAGLRRSPALQLSNHHQTKAMVWFPQCRVNALTEG